MRSERLGDLHRERAHPSRRAIDQDPLAWRDLPLIAKTLQSGRRRHGHGRRLLERQPRRLRHEEALRGAADVLGKGSAARTEDLIAGSKLRDVLPDRLDLPSHVHTHGAALWLAQPCHHADEVRAASHHVPVVGVDRSRAHADENAVIVDQRLLDVL